MFALVCLVYCGENGGVDEEDEYIGTAHVYSDGAFGYFIDTSWGMKSTKEIKGVYICKESEWSDKARVEVSEVPDVLGVLVCVLIGVDVAVMFSLPMIQLVINKLGVLFGKVDIHSGVDELQSGQDSIFGQLMNIARNSSKSAHRTQALLDTITGCRTSV
jgi:hypothetical protein